MAKCIYCGRNYESMLGISIVDSVSGNIKSYCSSKCRKNALMKRKKKKWTKQTVEAKVKK